MCMTTIGCTSPPPNPAPMHDCRASRITLWQLFQTISLPSLLSSPPPPPPTCITLSCSPAVIPSSASALSSSCGRPATGKWASTP